MDNYEIKALRRATQLVQRSGDGFGVIHVIVFGFIIMALVTGVGSLF